jgi:hypothetical protein
MRGSVDDEDLAALGEVLGQGQVGLIVVYEVNMADQIAASMKSVNTAAVSRRIDAYADELATARGRRQQLTSQPPPRWEYARRVRGGPDTSSLSVAIAAERECTRCLPTTLRAVGTSRSGRFPGYRGAPAPRQCKRMWFATPPDWEAVIGHGRAGGLRSQPALPLRRAW